MDKKWAEVLENLPSFGAYGKAKLIYDKCMDDQLSPYSTYDTGFPSRYFKFKQVVGVAFPLLTNSSESLYKPLPERMAEILLFLMPEDINIFTEATVRTTHYNTSDYSFVLEFAEPYLLLDDYYHRREDGEKRNETKTELVKIIARAAELLNITIDTSVVEDGVESVLEFEKRLVKFILLTPEQATAAIGLLNYTHFVSLYSKDASVEIKERLQHGISIVKLEQATRLAKYLRSDNVTATEVYNYIYIKFIYLYNDRLKKGENSNVTLEFAQCNCTDVIFKNFLPLTARLYYDNIQKDVEKKLKQEEYMLKMIETMREALKAQISQLPLSSIAKNKMIAKAAAIRFDTTIANHLLSHTQLDDYYKTFIPSVNDSYLDNVEALHLFEMKRQRSLLLQKGRKILPELEGDEIGGSPFYDFNYNLINPSEIVYDSDLFSPQYPDSINYGGMGAVIGHEMFHAFDTGNLGYNANGDIGYWLDKKTEEYVRKMRVCVVEQYRSIIEKESFGSKAEFSLDENIPDIAGLHLAYNAFKSLPKTEEGPQNPNDDQLFFIAFARSFCQSKRAEPDDPEHLPDKLPAQGSLMSLEPFQKAFGCKETGPYVPTKRCNVYF
ncbi:unnamed protein product [Bursaphelenchus xylophilus]|nr:unnamed protein product [Bursaphelenchus xylophilus]CAG9121585.1 unnamed protein product [Bursaphelenchus xylophilus]